MPGSGLLKIREDKLQALIVDLYLKGKRSEVELAQKTGIHTNTIKNMLAKHAHIRSRKNLQALFNVLVPADVKDNQARIAAVEALIDEYCEPVEQATPEPPEAPGALLACLTSYVKVFHLRDKRGGVPVYRKFVPRLKRTVDVYDEFIMIKSLCFKEVQQHQELYVRSSGVVDMQLIFPPHDDVIVSDPGLRGIEGVLRHSESEPSRFYQSSSCFENGLQYGNEEVGNIISEDCDRAVQVVDLMSLPIRLEELFSAPPTVYHLRPDARGMAEKRMSCWQTPEGLWLSDSARPGPADGGQGDCWQPETDRLRKNDKIEMRFSINWDAVNRQQG